MKKILVILIAGLMLAVSTTAVAAIEYGEGMLRSDETMEGPIGTTVLVAGGGGTSDIEPYIKYKWELVEEGGPELDYLVNDDTNHNHLSVALNPFGTRTVHYFTIVRKETFNLDRCYVDIWHPDHSFKYQVELFKLDLQPGIDAWNYVTTNYPEVIVDNIAEGWSATLEELVQEDAFVYEGCADLSYCQPAGWYTVAARAVDTHGLWSLPVWNWFWYIPTASIDLDFDLVNYGSAAECEWQWTGGDTIWDESTGANPATVRNTGNVPLKLAFKQDDMGFGETVDGDISYWNVEFDARLGDAVSGDNVTYLPDEISETVETLELCTQDKLDFSIHIIKGTATYQYTGNMWIYAYTQWLYGPYVVSPYCPDVGQDSDGIAPTGVPDPLIDGFGFEP